MEKTPERREYDRRISNALAHLQKRDNDYIYLEAKYGELNDKINEIHHILTNGFKQEITDSIKDMMERFCKDIKERLDALEKESWFGEWITKFRNKLFIFVVLSVLFAVAQRFTDLIVAWVKWW